MKIKYNLPIFLLMLIVFLAGSSAVLADEMTYSERGKYIYDEADVLPVESELALSSYLWKLDVRTDYEIIIVFPKETLTEEEISQRFDQMGVGKKDLDNGTAIFVFPDKSVFVAIGSGNDRVSVAQSKTDGERILKNFDEDPVLSLLRFVNVLAGRLADPVSTEKGGGFLETIRENLPLIFLWALVLSLIAFLIQQINGFQKTDLILPIILLVLAGIFAGSSIVSGNNENACAKEYGVITNTQHRTHDWVEMRVISTGKTTVVIPIFHTDYINEASLLSYNLKPHQYVFKTTDNRGAWEHETGEFDALTVHIKDGDLVGVDSFDDRSGGKTIGDGVWLRR